MFLKPSQAQVCSVPPVGARRSPLTRLHPSSTTQGGAACSSPWLRLEISKGLSIVQHSTCLRSHRSSESKKGGGRNKGGQKWGRGEKGAGRKEREAKAQRKGGKGGEKGKPVSPENCYNSQNILTRNKGYSLEFDRNLRERSG